MRRYPDRVSVSGNLATEERHAWLRKALEREGHMKIADAAKALDVSEMTIRRDLQELEAVGLVRRVRGGAVAVGPVAFADRHRQRSKAKGRIADKLLPLIPPTGPIGFDASSTLLRLASAMQSGRDTSVITNGVETFTALQGKPGITALLTGGELDERTGSLVGPLACRSAGSLLLTRLFVSAAAVHPDLGTSETCLEEVEVKRALVGTAADVVLAVDSSKLGTRAVAVGVEWEKVTTLVTELDPTDRRLDPYRALADIL